ncbi:MAG: hypothetical protein COB53_03345 [Elusimicrobia bacterium]|nr:MAG: hypothetical protein COB53_03345 [Elusimicrobiota bacterium]
MDNFIKKLFYSFLGLIIIAAPLRAADPFAGFQQFVDRPSLKPFARDLGGLLGAATFHNGRNLGFSGFDVGIRGAYRFSSEAGNRVLRDKGVKAYGLPWVQAEIGLPFALDGYIRGVTFQGTTISGGGLRYGITKKSDSEWHPQILVSWSGHSVSHRHFSATHVGANLVVSFNFKKIAPYFGGGVDRTRLVVKTTPVRDASLVDESATVNVPRATLGLTIRPKPYLYLNLAATFTNRAGLDSGIGIRF